MSDRLAGPALLFCPANRPDRYDRATAAADTALVDLEDAVPPDQKRSARDAVRAALTHDPDRFVVRVNGRDTQWYADDVAMLRDVGASRVLLPKVGSPDDVTAVGDLDVVALCETVHGIQHAQAIAEVDNCIALFWGAEDLTAALGGRSSRRSDGAYHAPIQHARTNVLFAAAAAGKLAVDAVYLDLDDDATLRAECVAACDVGFAAKGCIHPRQVDVVRAAFAPSEHQLAWAERLMAAKVTHGSGVFVYEGRMVDGPLYAQATRILSQRGT